MPLQYRGAQLLYPLGPCVPRRGITGSKYHAAWPYLPFSFRRKFSKPQGLSTTLDVLAVVRSVLLDLQEHAVVGLP